MQRKRKTLRKSKEPIQFPVGCRVKIDVEKLYKKFRFAPFSKEEFGSKSKYFLAEVASLSKDPTRWRVCELLGLIESLQVSLPVEVLSNAKTSELVSLALREQISLDVKRIVSEFRK